MSPINGPEADAFDGRAVLRHRLAWLAWEVPCYGLVLWGLLRVNTARFGLPDLMTVVGFLLFFVAFRLLIRPMDSIRRGPGYALAVLCALGFAALLLHESSRVRARWYRSTILEVRLAALVADSPVPVVIADQDGRITGFNHQAERLTGYVGGDLIGRNVEILVTPDLLPAFRAAYKWSIEGLRATPSGWLDETGFLIPIRRKDGGSVLVSFFGFGLRYGEEMDLFGVLAPAGGLSPPRIKAKLHGTPGMWPDRATR